MIYYGRECQIYGNQDADVYIFCFFHDCTSIVESLKKKYPTQERGQDLYFRKIQIRLAKTDLVHRRQNNQADNQRGRFAYVAVPTRKQYGRQDARPADHMEKR